MRSIVVYIDRKQDYLSNWDLYGENFIEKNTSIEFIPKFHFSPRKIIVVFCTLQFPVTCVSNWTQIEMSSLIAEASGRSKFMSCAVLLDNNFLTGCACELILSREDWLSIII
jgi:hypothetical protein